MIFDFVLFGRPGKSESSWVVILVATILMSCGSSPTIFPLNKSTNPPPSQSPQVSDFFPTSASEGVLVTISGVNFKGAVNNATPDVRFNGKAATISPTFSANSIVAKVPNGTTNGPITVTVGGLTGTSNTDFIVPSLIGSWLQVSRELANCTDPNDNTVFFCNSCATITFSASLLTIAEPGVPPIEIPYVLSGNLLILSLPDGATRTDTYAIVNSTLTTRYDASFGCKGTDTWTRI